MESNNRNKNDINVDEDCNKNNKRGSSFVAAKEITNSDVLLCNSSTSSNLRGSMSRMKMVVMIPYYDTARNCYYPAGNENFSILVNEYHTMNLHSSQTSKDLVARTIVQAIHQQSPRGRFLVKAINERPREDDTVKPVVLWKQVTDEQAEELTSQELSKSKSKNHHHRHHDGNKKHKERHHQELSKKKVVSKDKRTASLSSSSSSFPSFSTAVACKTLGSTQIDSSNHGSKQGRSVGTATRTSNGGGRDIYYDTSSIVVDPTDRLISEAEITQHDVLSGKKVADYRDHPGNSYFLYLASKYNDLYRCSARKTKYVVAKTIIEAMMDQDPPGRFLEKVFISEDGKESDTWKEMKYKDRKSVV